MKRKPTDDRLPGRSMVLLGIGHTNAHIVRQWGMHPIADTQLTCISDWPFATYSGMLPAVLAQQIPRDRMQIDLVRLCSSVGARLIVGTVTGLDLTQQQLHFQNRPSIPFDVLSIGIGSVPIMSNVRVEGQTLVKIKPMQTFFDRLSATIHRALHAQQQAIDRSAGDTPLNVVVVGSGAAGVEVTLCLPPFLNSQGVSKYHIEIVTRSDAILPGVISSLRSRAATELQRRNVHVSTDSTVTAVLHDSVQLSDGRRLKADLVIWATGASPPELLQHLNLPVDGQGFPATDHTLRSTSGAPVFCVGDTGTMVAEHLPKAGVYAVRQGPVLWKNLKASLNGEPLHAYKPQRSFLKLMNSGDGRALGEWKGFSFSGRWVRRLKDRIDGRFMQMYQVHDKVSNPNDVMQCRGCGSKLGRQLLDAGLQQAGDSCPTTSVKDPQSSDSTSMPESMDDAAEIITNSGVIVASTDFFTNPVDDAFLFGRMAALHSASDVIAMGARPTAALANIVLPEGNPNSQQTALQDFMAGARQEFSAMNATVVGGHTIVGPRWEAGFTVMGQPIATHLLRKRNLQRDDLLYVTKPLGIGILLAAHQRSQCHAQHYTLLLNTMLQRQHQLAQIAIDCGIKAATDVTGFGLAGHLQEMLQASQLSATLQLHQIPLLPGVERALSQNIQSSLSPANRHVETCIDTSADLQLKAEYHALFDPQTCGGLLLAVSPLQAQAFEAAIATAELGPAVAIGSVIRSDHNNSTIHIR